MIKGGASNSDSGRGFTNDLEVAAGKGNLEGNVLYRLRIPSALAHETDSLSNKAAEIPVIVEWPGHHRKEGGHVVYLDGHQEYVSYPGKFPMTESFIEGLRRLDALSGQAPVPAR